MKVHVKGGGTVNLTQADFVSSGGEAAVYAKGSTAFKVYHTPSKMIPVGKIADLANLNHPSIIKPDKVLTNSKGTPVGYTMAYKPDTYVLCQLFPRAFREREGLDHSRIVSLVNTMREGVELCHNRHVLLVDLNEMNFLVSKNFGQVYFIDVDSYQTLSYKATALMESVRDRHMAPGDFTALTDWFSFAVVTFQMFTGIHPYKGKHPTLRGFDARMQANVSVFNPEVRVPRAAYPFTVIPTEWRDWYKSVFEDGQRWPPPGSMAYAGVALIPTIKTVSGAHLLIAELASFNGPVRATWHSFGSTVVLTGDGLYLNQRRVSDGRRGIVVGWTPKMNKAISVLPSSGSPPRMFNLTDGHTIQFGNNAEQVMSTAGRVYIKNLDKVLEVVFTETGNNVLASTHLACNVLPQATRLFEGGVLQNLLGSTYISLFPRSKSTYQAHFQELDEYKVIEAKYKPSLGGGVLMVIGVKGGQYDRLVFRFDEAMNRDLRVVEDITPTGLNFVVLDTGVVVTLTEDDKLELCSARKGSPQVKVVEDKTLGPDMTLGTTGGQVTFSRGNKTYSMRMR